jgi:hypothetical protein
MLIGVWETFKRKALTLNEIKSVRVKFGELSGKNVVTAIHLMTQLPLMVFIKL